MKISILLLTFNEAENLPSCIAALDWADDIVLLDSFSHDDTVEIAEKFGARVYQRAFDNFAGQRNFALNNFDFKHEWILHLDADEIVPKKLYVEMLQAVECGAFDAWRIPSKMIFFGHWLRYSGMYPSYQVRLGHRDRLRFKQVGHGQREDLPLDRVGTLAEPYLHYSFSKGFTEWVEKHNRYSTDEAHAAAASLANGIGIDWTGLVSRDPTRRRRALKVLSWRLPFRPTLRFLYMYLLRRGFLDGHAGFVYCRLLTIYEYLIVLKRKEISKKHVVMDHTEDNFRAE